MERAETQLVFDIGSGIVVGLAQLLRAGGRRERGQKATEGQLLLGQYERKPVAVMQGRFHYYEGHSMESIALPVRVLEYLGLKNLIITSAVGSMRAQIKQGHLAAISDHINLMGRNPLRAF